MSRTGTLQDRQIWRTSTDSQTGPPAFCTPFALPSGGIIAFNDSFTTTLTADVQFSQPCIPNSTIINPGVTGNSTVVGLRDPFYASTSPQIYAIAAATVISYLLVVLIFITPRTFFVGGPGGGVGVLERHGVANGSYGSGSVTGVGRRPWLQKIATITVAISLTIATADTFRVVEEQYDAGYVDAGRLVDDVLGSLEIRIVRVVSDTFLWLAQVQTLIRLFPRHKEKVTIKWLGFAMVSMDTIFSILNDFLTQSNRVEPRTFTDAIPALSYLFELSISLIYASCVIYYSLSKRRFAFWHPKMRNICLVALLSLMAVLVPVVFFVLDVSNPDVAGWGDYIRWVGAAAASVAVWEWVERIEALERDEKKDGILGRQIFDGDEMIDDAPSEEIDWPRRREYWDEHGNPSNSTGHSQGGGPFSKHLRVLRPRIPFAQRFRKDSPPTSVQQPAVALAQVNQPSIPPPAATPISRSDTTSAASTVYAIRYYNLNSASPAIPEEPPVEAVASSDPNVLLKELSNSSTSTSDESDEIKLASNQQQDAPAVVSFDHTPRHPLWTTVSNPFKRKRTSPPAEVAGAQLREGTARRSPVDLNMNLRSRLGGFTSLRKRMHHERVAKEVATPMAVTVIPAQRRGTRTWSPETNEIQDSEADHEDSEHHPDTDPEGGPESLDSARLTVSTLPFSQTHETDMPVTIIPAPKRGQRTWSPDDLHHSTPPHQLQDLMTQRANGQSASPPRAIQAPARNNETSPNGPVLSNRGSLTFSEQPRRQTLRTVSESTTDPNGEHEDRRTNHPTSHSVQASPPNSRSPDTIPENGPVPASDHDQQRNRVGDVEEELIPAVQGTDPNPGSQEER